MECWDEATRDSLEQELLAAGGKFGSEEGALGTTPQDAAPDSPPLSPSWPQSYFTLGDFPTGQRWSDGTKVPSDHTKATPTPSGSCGLK